MNEKDEWALDVKGAKMFDVDGMSEEEQKNNLIRAMTFLGVAKLLLPVKTFKQLSDATVLLLIVQDKLEIKNNKPNLSNITFTVFDPDEGGDDRNN